MRDDEFKPKLGRIGSTKARQGRGYIQRVLHAAKYGGRPRKSQRHFDGSRIGRGAGIGRVLGSRDHFAGFRARRVVVQARLVKLVGKGLAGAHAHLRYIQRDGVTRQGEAGALYGAEQDKVDGQAFVERAQGDRHQFRFIVSAEDAARYEDLMPFVRRLMARMEQDLGTKLDWVAADHFNTGHPHSHIVVRGKADDGKDLIIAREYISHGMRERAAEIVSLDLGPRSDLEIQARLASEVEKDRFTSIDRDILRNANAEHVVAAMGADGPVQSLQAGRLQKLGRLGLATEVEPGRWQLAADLKFSLQRLGERGDIIKTMHRELARADTPRATLDYAIYDPADAATKKMTGQVAGQGLPDELQDRRYLIVDGLDGRVHYVDLGVADPADMPRAGAIVAVEPRPIAIRPSDRTVSEIAAAHEGYYSAHLHALHDPAASPEFIQAHIRRLEALRRGGLETDRRADGLWKVQPNHLERVTAYEQAQVRARPVRLEILCDVPFERQINAVGATWLDRELTGPSRSDLRDAGFGHAAREALDRRRQWLIAQGLAWDNEGCTVFAKGMVSELQRRELAKVGKEMVSELGLPYAEIVKGDQVSGRYSRRLDLISGRFAVVENSRAFSLIPWRPTLEQYLGREVSGIMRESGGISWAFGRHRTGPAR